MIQCWVPSVYAEDPSCSRIRYDMDKGTDRMKVVMVLTSQGDPASVRTPAMSNGSYSVPGHRCHDPYPLVTRGMWKAWVLDKFDFCMYIRISSSVQAQRQSVWARLGVLRTPSPRPSSGLVLLDHPEWCALRDVTEAQRFPCVSLFPHCCDVLCLSVTIT